MFDFVDFSTLLQTVLTSADKYCHCQSVSNLMMCVKSTVTIWQATALDSAKKDDAGSLTWSMTNVFYLYLAHTDSSDIVLHLSLQHNTRHVASSGWWNQCVISLLLSVSCPTHLLMQVNRTCLKYKPVTDRWKRLSDVYQEKDTFTYSNINCTMPCNHHVTFYRILIDIRQITLVHVNHQWW